MPQQEPPLRFMRQYISEAAEMDRETMEDHVESMHIPPRRRGPLQAIPFASVRLDDVTVARAIEMLRTAQDGSVEVVARILEVPPEALELALAEYRPRWRQFILARAT